MGDVSSDTYDLTSRSSFTGQRNMSSVLRFFKGTAVNIQGGSNMTGKNCDLFTHKSSRSYLNHLVQRILLHTPKSRMRGVCLCSLISVMHT